MEKTYVNYGCGLSAPKEWINFDASPTLKIQKNPILKVILKKKLNVIFPDNVLYGDIIKGLPIQDNKCDGLYCSHTLEHLSLNDFRKSIKNSYKILKKGGIFRCVLPDLEWSAREYIKNIDLQDSNASIKFLEETILGTKSRIYGLKGIIKHVYGNSNHLWMWDKYSLTKELEMVGFKEIRTCVFNDSEDSMFKYVENEGRFKNCLAIECKK